MEAINEPPPDVWFYSRDGQRLGPLSLAELRAKVLAGELNPRLDLVWTQGMTDWQPAGEIDALFERRMQQPPTITIPQLVPGDESVGELMRQVDDWPGTSRRGYLAANILLPILWNVAIIFVPALVGTSLEPVLLQQITLGGSLLLCIILIYYGLQRLANLGMSRWWYLGYLVPLLNLWIGYRCFACPAGYAYHKTMDGIGIALAIIYWLLLLALILAGIAMAVVFIGLANDPNLQEQLQQWLQKLSDQA
jgi:hypothetical protein